VTVKRGASGVKDAAGNALAATWCGRLLPSRRNSAQPLWESDLMLVNVQLIINEGRSTLL
jgi:hypothetical protein